MHRGPTLMASRILIVEPDDHLRESLRLHLSLEGYQCDARSDLCSVIGPVAAERFDLAVVNLLTTRGRGAGHATDLETMGVPTLLLAGPAGEDAALSALERWADDYVTLPVEMRELIARVHALVRRMSAAASDAESAGGRGGTVVHNGLLIDPSRRHIELEGRVLKLTEYEFRLLHTLGRRPGVVFPRRRLLSELWGANILVQPRSIDALVMRVRRRMRTVSSRWQIATLRRIGYQFKNTADQES